MENLFNGLFWASVYMLVAGFFYFALIRRQNNPGLSRGYILTTLVASLVLGLNLLPRIQGMFQSNGFSDAGILLPEFVIEASSGMQKAGEGMASLGSQKAWILIVYLVVVGLLLLRLMLSVAWLMLRMVRRGIVRSHGLRLVVSEKPHAPFSFMGLVYVSRQLMQDPDMESILLHEKAHLRRWHSFDLMFLELITAIFWFHPLVWMLRRELKQQHEYEADRYVLDNKVEKVYYQKLLLNFAAHGLRIPLVNSFHVSPLKKRILMMNKKTKTNLFRLLLSAAIVLPFVGAVLLMQSVNASEIGALLTNNESPTMASAPIDWAYALTGSTESAGGQTGSTRETQNLIDPAYALMPGAASESGKLARAQDPQRARQTDDEIFTVVEVQPQFPGGEEARQAYLREHLRYPNEAREKGIQGTVFVAFVIAKDGSIQNAKILRGIGGGCDEEALRVIQGMPNWIPGRLKGEAVAVQFNMPVRFVLDTSKPGDGTATKVEGEKPAASNDIVLVIDGKLVVIKDKIEINSLIRPDEISHMEVVAGEAARQKYGHDKVIVITRK